MLWFVDEVQQHAQPELERRPHPFARAARFQTGRPPVAAVAPPW